MTLLQGFGFLTAATEAASKELDIEALADQSIEKFWAVMPGFTVSVMRIAVLVIPVIMLVLGFVGLLCPPKEANWLIGYSTRRSVASDEAWFFAQKLRGMIWSIAGAALLIPSLILNILMKDATMDYICRMVITYGLIQVAVLLISLLALRIVMLVYFDGKGRRKR